MALGQRLTVAILLSAAPSVAAVVAALVLGTDRRTPTQPSARPPADVTHAACFGAASRDPWQRCDNPALRLDVVPAPEVAPTLPNSACAPVASAEPLSVCSFGVPAAKAAATIALVGDSHAGDWRAAVAEVAVAEHWHGLSITHTSCPLSEAVRDLSDPLRFASCARWKQEVVRWFTQHPEVSTVFVAGLSGGSGVIPRGRRGPFATAVDGYIEAWYTLPRSVRHIVVIRDTPKDRATTSACIERALARHLPPDATCPVPRSFALDPDPLTVAAMLMGSPRVQTVDLTRVFCNRRWCLPVIGGSLVLRDATHLTKTFASTMGPLLLHQLHRLMAMWPARDRGAGPPRDRRAVAQRARRAA